MLSVLSDHVVVLRCSSPRTLMQKDVFCLLINEAIFHCKGFAQALSQVSVLVWDPFMILCAQSVFCDDQCPSSLSGISKGYLSALCRQAWLHLCDVSTSRLRSIHDPCISRLTEDGGYKVTFLVPHLPPSLKTPAKLTLGEKQVILGMRL